MKLGLVMIVKNESAIIERCLDRVKDIIDFVVITDTGSIDNTVELIENYLLKNGIDGGVYHRPFKNFGYNRTNSFENAVRYAVSQKWSRNSCYSLLLDADMELIVSKDFKKEDIVLPSYRLTQKNSLMEWDNMRLVNMGYDWTCVGVTHEYWSSPIELPCDNLKTLYINDVGDGGCKDDKFKRDLNLLLNGLMEEPTNYRYMFYLANTYKALGKFHDAIRWYRKRIEAGGWEEERWYAMYQEAMCYKELGKSDKFQCKMLEAYNTRPHRVEPIYHLTRWYREKGMNSIAYMFSKIGLSIKNNGDVLFCEVAPHDHGFLQEISICGFYDEMTKMEGSNATNLLLLNRGVPRDVREEAESNMLFYIDKLNATQEVLRIPTPRIELLGPRSHGIDNVKIVDESIDVIVETSNTGISNGTDSGVCELRYRQMNTSITECGSLALVRTVNYDQEKCVYTIHDDNQIIKTRNFLLNMHRFHSQQNCDMKERKVLEEDLIEIVLSEKTEYNYERKQHNITGLEDARIFIHKRQAWFTCTLTDACKDHYLPKIGLCKIDGKWNHKQQKLVGCTGHVDNVYLLEGPNPNRCEKNWLPYSMNGKIFIIYGYEPFTIYGVADDFKLEKKISANINMDLSTMRGSASPIKIKTKNGELKENDRNLIILHQVFFAGGKRTYVHRFMLLSEDMVPYSVSKPFYLMEKDIEFIMGCYYKDGFLHITAGIKDKSTYLFHLSKENMSAMIGEEVL